MKKKFRVLQVCRSIYTAKILLISLAKALNKNGYEVEFACSSDKKEYRFFKFPVNDIDIPKIFNLFTAMAPPNNTPPVPAIIFKRTVLRNTFVVFIQQLNAYITILNLAAIFKPHL